MKNLRFLIVLLLVPVLTEAQPAPTFEATSNQVAAGVVGAPFYVSPRSLAGSGLGSPTNGQTAPQVSANIANSAVLQTNGVGTNTILTKPSFVGTTIIYSGGTNSINMSNLLASQSSPTNVTLSSGLYDGGANAIQMKTGNSLKGNGPDNTTVIVYNTSADTTTNGGSFWLSDNCSVSDLYINQTNVEGWCITPIGAQRKNQTAPVPSAGNLAATSTNVVVRNVKVNGAKTGTIIVNCTNVFDWRIINCDLSATANEAVSFGLANTSGDGPTPIECLNTNDYGEIIDTSLEVKSTGSSFQCGAFINFSGTAKLILNKVNLNGSAACAAVRVKGTNSVVHVSLVGAQTHPNASSYTSLYVDGSTNTIYLEGGVASILDLGNGNTYITNQQVLVIAPASIPITAADSTWMSITNAVAITNQPTTIGQALVVVGTNANGATMVKGTNWPTGSGGSQTPWAQDIDGGTFKLGGVGQISQTNASTQVGVVYSPFKDSTYGAAVLLSGFTNGFTAPSVIELDNLIAAGTVQGATVIVTGGSVSLIPTNAAVVSTVVGVAATLPFGVTNSLAGRAEPVVQYYMIDGASGVPVMTCSNETTGVKLTKGKGSLASLTETNWFTLPITSTNTIWRIRDESTGSGASVGILTNWFIGL